MTRAGLEFAWILVCYAHFFCCYTYLIVSDTSGHAFAAVRTFSPLTPRLVSSHPIIGIRHQNKRWLGVSVSYSICWHYLDITILHTVQHVRPIVGSLEALFLNVLNNSS